MKKILSVIFLCGIPSILLAEGLQVKPGMWEITATSENSMMGAARTRTIKKCMTEPEFDPSTQMQGMDKDQCQTTSKVTGNKMDYTIKCSSPDSGDFSGQGTFISKGDTMNSVMNIQGSAEGQTITMKVSTKGKRIGDC
jgi:hypothetical protein